MKKIFTLLFLSITSLSYAQMRDYDLQSITIDVQQNVNDCKLTLVLDDKYYPIKPSKINGSIITLDLIQYQDYLLIINCNDYINITTQAYDIIDERDLDISADVDWHFQDGILLFNYK